MLFHLKSAFEKHKSGAFQSVLFALLTGIFVFFVSPAKADEAIDLSVPRQYTFNYETQTFDTSVSFVRPEGGIYVLFMKNPKQFSSFYIGNNNWSIGDSDAFAQFRCSTGDLSACVLEQWYNAPYAGLMYFTDNTILSINGATSSILKLADNAQISAQFLYPKMLAPVYHADIQMPLLTTHVSVKLHVSKQNLTDVDSSHWFVTIFKTVDGSFDVVDSVDPYTESKSLGELSSMGNVDFSVPLLGGNTGYYSVVFAPDSAYATAYPDYPHFFKYNFSLKGLTPDDPNYITGQSPFIKPDSEVGSSTGSVLGDLLRDVASFLFVPNETLYTETIGAEWTLMQTTFAPLIQIYGYSNNAPQTADAIPIYTGSLTLNGHSTPFVYDPFHTLSIPSIVPTFMTYMFYLALGWFLIKNISNIFPE